MKLFHYAQYLFYPFFALTLFFIIKGSVFDQSLEDVGFGVLCMGIAFGFSSMGDITDISAKEERLFQNPKRFRWQVLYMAFTGISLTIVTSLFIIQKWVGKGDLSEPFYHLGLNCAPLIIAVFFTLKQLLDKKKYYELIGQESSQESLSTDVDS